MTTVPTIPGPQASRVNKDSASDTIWYQYELGIGSAVKSSVPNTTKVVAGTGLVGGGALSSDVTLALAATSVMPASYGGATKTISLTVNEYGQLTAASEAIIDLSGLGGVPQTRLINTTAPLTGGGDLSANRTFAIAASALTKTDDTNVTLTLGGTPASALLAAASLTLGWTGVLAVGRGGTGADLSATGGTSKVLKQVSSGAAVTVAQLAAADLSDYATGTWTPVVTISVPGDLSVTYSTQVGTYTKIGRMVLASFSIITSAFTWTTANGQALVTGLPFTAINTSGANWAGSLVYGGITKATYTQFSARVLANTSNIELIGSGSGVAASAVQAAEIPSGGSVLLRGTLMLEVQ